MNVKKREASIVDVELNKIELEPCPFCGRQAIIQSHPGYNWNGAEEHVNVGAMHGLWYVGCSYEAFPGLDDTPWCHIKPAACWYASLIEAIEHWNRREYGTNPRDK